MPEIKRIFQAGKMNRTLDDRLVPNGEYREALNININKSDSSDVGAAENVLGNIQILNGNPIDGGVCIGSYRDNGNEKIYFFVTDNVSVNEDNLSGVEHGVFEYDQRTNSISRLATGSWLNFHVNFTITGINFVDGLLFWTDNRNEPRKINVGRARNDGAYYNSDNRAAVAKLSPYVAPFISQISTTGSNNFLEDKLPRFAYRYKFEDGEFSTISPFTPIAFSNNIVDANGNIANGEISGFINQARQVFLRISVPNGYGITGVEFLYNESTTSNIYILDDISVDPSISSPIVIDYTYDGQDPFRTLPANQLTRVYDAIPRRARSQEFAGGRLIYGNYLQNYNIPSISFTVTVANKPSGESAVYDRFSIKSRRTYQVGVVLADRFGRQTPVILSSTGGDTVFVSARTGNDVMQQLQLTFNSDLPSWAHSYRIVVKQRQQEYYNVLTTGGGTSINVNDDSLNKIPRDTTEEAIITSGGAVAASATKVYAKLSGTANNTSDNQLQVSRLNIADTGERTANIPGLTASSTLTVVETIPRESELDIFYETSTGGLVSSISGAINVEFYNCWILNFGSTAHLELNRLRAGFNEPFFTVGIKAYVVQENFAEERRFNTLIHSSGLFNSRTGINYVNQFNEAEGGITLSLDPADGSIQKLYAEDTQLLIFQEDKISRSPIDKDFIYSAEGGAVPVTSSTQYLGTIAPFAGEYGISTDPESFAVYGTRKYLSDRNRGVVLRLSNDGITEISNYGLGDFFRDAIFNSTRVIGSYDEYHDHYNITIVGGSYYAGIEDTNVATALQGFFTVSFEEEAKGWPSFKSYRQEGGLTLNNRYYTFNGGDLWQHDAGTVYNSFYNIQSESYLECIFNDNPSDIKEFKTVNYEGEAGWICDSVITEQDDLRRVIDANVLLNTSTQSLNVTSTLLNSDILQTKSILAEVGTMYNWTIKIVPSSPSYLFNGVGDVTINFRGDAIDDADKTFNSGEQAIYYTTPNLTATEANVIHDLTVSGGAVEDISGAILTISLVDNTEDVLIEGFIPTSGAYTSAFRAGAYTYAYDAGDLNTDVEVGMRFVDPNDSDLLEFNEDTGFQAIFSDSLSSLLSGSVSRVLLADKSGVFLRQNITLPSSTVYGSLTLAPPSSGDLIRRKPVGTWSSPTATGFPTGASMQVGLWSGTANVAFESTGEVSVAPASGQPSNLGGATDPDSRQLFIYPNDGFIWVIPSSGTAASFDASSNFNNTSSTLTRVTSANGPSGSANRYLGGYRLDLNSIDTLTNDTRIATNANIAIAPTLTFISANVIAEYFLDFTLDNDGTDETSIINGDTGSLTLSLADATAGNILLQSASSLYNYRFWLTNSTGTTDVTGLTLVVDPGGAGEVVYDPGTMADSAAGDDVPNSANVAFTFDATFVAGDYRLYFEATAANATNYQNNYGAPTGGEYFVNLNITT